MRTLINITVVSLIGLFFANDIDAQSVNVQFKTTKQRLDLKFEKRTQEVREINETAVRRHAEMLKRYKRKMQAIEEQISKGSFNAKLLKGIVPEHHKPIYGTLPYKHLNWKAEEPIYEPQVVPAYQGGDMTVSPDDTLSTLEAPINEEIANRARNLNWDPAAIYNWVNTNIESEWYFGCMKGAEETLRQGSGNDCDQAALLVALLRASGYPTRYVRGVIEVHPDLDQLLNLTGVADANQLAKFFQKTGIPHKPIISGGQIRNIQFTHIWVEARVPYHNYRGIIIEDNGEQWLAMDTHIKAAGYDYGTVLDLPEEVDLTQVRDNYLQLDRLETPLEFIETEYNVFSEGIYQSLLKQRTSLVRDLEILPASLQFKEIAIIDEFTQIPDDLIHKARFVVEDLSKNILFDTTLDVLSLSNQSIALYYEPETVEDQEIIGSYGGLNNTPAYLVRLRPVLKINGERIAVGLDGLPMGEDANYVIELISPRGTERIENTIIIGNLVVTGLVAQEAVQLATTDDRNAERLLREETVNYLTRWAQSEDELASLLRVSLARPIPTVINMGGVIDVTYVLDTPHGYQWKGVYVDADLRTIEVVGDNKKTFMQLSALEGSVLEDRIIRDDFEVDSVSTARLLAIAQGNMINILTIDTSNIDSVLPILPFAENVIEDIRSSINQNYVVTIPEQLITYEDWSGIGYIKENMETGESGWMLSGMIAGGMSVFGPERWNEYADTLRNPNGEPDADPDPLSGQYILKIASTDMQNGVVGKKLTETGLEMLKIKVLDQNNASAAGVTVRFSSLSGGGKLIDGAIEVDTVEVVTDVNGFASVDFELGTSTYVNMDFIEEVEGPNLQQVSINLVDAEIVTNGTKIAKPFRVIAYPDRETVKVEIKGEESVWVDVLSYTHVHLSVTDEHNNPISNCVTTFMPNGPITQEGSPCDANPNALPLKLVSTIETCFSEMTTYEACGSAGPITEWSYPDGAFAGVLVGSASGMDYNINSNVTCGSGQSVSQEHVIHLYPFGNCNSQETDLPGYKFFVLPEQMYDENSNIINAGKIATTYDVSTKMYVLEEKSEVVDEDIECDPAGCPPPPNICTTTGTCPVTVGTREYIVHNQYITYPSVTVDGLPATRDGLDYHREVVLSGTPGLHEISIEGSGWLDRTMYRYDCIMGLSCFSYLAQFELNKTTSMKVYSVDIQIENDAVFIPVDDYGYSIDDIVVKYNVLPADYVALSAYVVLMAEDARGETQPVLYIPGDRSGSGNATIVRGSHFNKEQRYYLKVVLNKGTSYEISSSQETNLRADENYIPIILGTFGVEKEDPEFPLVDLNWYDYYPPLGDKNIKINLGLWFVPDLTQYKVRATILSPLSDVGLVKDNEPADMMVEKNFDESGSVIVKLSGQALAPKLDFDDVDEIEIHFELLDQLGRIMAEERATWKVRNNFNTTLGEVLEGKAVFVYDTVEDENHIGVNEEEVQDYGKEKFEYVQMLLNQVVSRKRSVGTYVLIDEDGIFGDQTRDAIALYQHKDHFNVLIPDAAKKVAFNKLMKDYDKIGDRVIWYPRIVDKRLLVVEEEEVYPIEASIDPSLIDKADTGMLELYKNVVERIMHDMVINGAENGYIRQASDNWYSRPVAVNNKIFGPNYTANRHGPGMSYCYGCKDSVEDFNLVKPCVGMLATNPIDYRGNLDDNCNIVMGETNTGKWAGLYSGSQFHNGGLGSEWWAWYLGLFPVDSWNGVSTHEEYRPSFWAGIDCSGLVLRSRDYVDRHEEAMYSLYLDGFGILLPRMNSTYPHPRLMSKNFFGTGLGTATNPVVYPADGQLGNGNYVRYIENPSPHIGATIRNIVAARMNVQKKISMGDLVGYNSKHIAFVYTKKPTCDISNIQKRDCDMNIIHANGEEWLDVDGSGQVSSMQFTRKVLISSLSMGTLETITRCFGRITLWD
jgi:hypothetical protein